MPYYVCGLPVSPYRELQASAGNTALSIIQVSHNAWSNMIVFIEKHLYHYNDMYLCLFSYLFSSNSLSIGSKFLGIKVCSCLFLIMSQ